LASFEIAKKQWNQMKPLIIKFNDKVDASIQLLESIGSPVIID